MPDDNENSAESAEVKPEGQVEGEAPPEEDTAATPPESEEDGEDIITFGDEPPPEPEAETSTVKLLRKAYERAHKKNVKLQERLQQLEHSTQTAAAPDPGPMPTIEDCEMDTEKHKQRVMEWHAVKLKYDREQDRRKSEIETVQRRYEKKHNAYQVQKTELKVSDYDLAEMTVNEALNMTQRGILIQASENPAVLMYALGKNPAKLQEMASLRDDPVKFAFEAGKLEKTLKVSKRRPATAPEKTIEGSGNAVGAETNLNRLRDEAAKSHSINKNLEYRRKLRRQERGG